jgi:hypothetical protein
VGWDDTQKTAISSTLVSAKSWETNTPVMLTGKFGAVEKPDFV